MLNSLSTPLGNVVCQILSDGYKLDLSGSMKSSGHFISVQEFIVDPQWLPPGMHINSSLGWRWFIERTDETAEELVIECILDEPVEGCGWSRDEGDHLDAVGIMNDDFQLHIGSEDGDCHYDRSLERDWMPGRLETLLSGFQKEFICINHFTDYGIRSIIPPLNIGEKIYLHFIAALDKVRESPGFPGEQDASTWYAVDQQKVFLDKALELPE